MTFFEWVRSNSERQLLEAAQREMARKYLDQEPPAGSGSVLELFWSKLYVPVYRRLPWGVRKAIIQAMPGSHRREWGGRAPPEQRTSSTTDS